MTSNASTHPVAMPVLILQDEGVYTYDAAWLWWNRMNWNLKARPVDLWSSGRLADKALVMDEVARLTGDLTT
jgi:hypothetical protein